jgi:hypothetical protein
MANPFQAIVGRWQTEGHVIAQKPIPVRGSDVYETFPGGHFMIHHVDATVGESPVRAIEIIGEPDDQTDAVLAGAYDDQGAMTVMKVRIDDAGVCHFSGGGDIASAAQLEADITQHVRSTLEIAADRQTMTAFWERSGDGENWAAWMDIRFTRA